MDYRDCFSFQVFFLIYCCFPLVSTSAFSVVVNDFFRVIRCLLVIACNTRSVGWHTWIFCICPSSSGRWQKYWVCYTLNIWAREFKRQGTRLRAGRPGFDPGWWGGAFFSLLFVQTGPGVHSPVKWVPGVQTIKRRASHGCEYVDPCIHIPLSLHGL